MKKVVDASTAPDERLDEGTVAGHVALVLDMWRGVDVTERNRPSSTWSWLPFVGTEVHDPADMASHVGRTHRLSSDENASLGAMSKDPVGQMPFIAGRVAARIHSHPAWALEFFDEHRVRVDLVTEVTSIASRALAIRDQLAVLGRPPAGHLRADADVVTMYIEKSHAIDTSLDALMERLAALASYCAIIGDIQKREEKRTWIERVSAIGTFEDSVDATIDQLEANRLRDTATESALLADVYLDLLAPVATSLMLPGRTA